MADARDIEKLIKAVTERVLARLASPASGVEPGATPARRRRLLLLLPTPSARLKELAANAERLLRAGWPLRALCSEEVLADLDRLGLRARLGGRVQSLEQAGVGASLESLAPGDLLLLASLGFSSARRFAELDDDDPWVRLCSQAMLAGQRLAALSDDLSPRFGGGDGALQRRARGLLEGLRALGVELLGLEDLAGWLERVAAADVTLSQAVGRLLTERDVEALAASGEKRLVLPAQSIVTPLALSRAVELGLELRRE